MLAAVGCGQAPAAAIGRLTAMAHRAATINGDPNPVWITAVVTTRAKALTSATPGDYVPGSARVRVFLITMRGHFTARDASRPSGAKAPTGRYLSLVTGAKTFRASTSASAPNRHRSRPPASDRSPTSPAAAIDGTPQVTTLHGQP
jgi:hypothetical protein